MCASDLPNLACRRWDSTSPGSPDVEPEDRRGVSSQVAEVLLVLVLHYGHGPDGSTVGVTQQPHGGDDRDHRAVCSLSRDDELPAACQRSGLRTWARATTAV